MNVTPDSFSDGGITLETNAAITHGMGLLAEGAAILDVGGESTRPDANPVEPEIEQARILPVIRALAENGACISVDTRNASTMARALDCGATIVNDVTALRHDPAAIPLVAARSCPVILMHMRGTPKTMRSLTNYNDVAEDVLNELSEQIEACVAAGIRRAKIAIDPGFGFAKTTTQSIDLLRGLPRFLKLCCPIIAGMSRKSFIGEIAQVEDIQERDVASAAAGVLALSLGARVLRVHNVAATMQTVRVWKALHGVAAEKENEA